MISAARAVYSSRVAERARADARGSYHRATTYYAALIGLVEQNTLEMDVMCAHVMVPFFQRARSARKKKGTITWVQRYVVMMHILLILIQL